MSDPAIRVAGLGKRYHIGRLQERHDTLRDAVVAGLRVPLDRLRIGGQRRDEPQTMDNAFWALRDLTFDVQRGEVLGIIGRNGAGKSTLLKILSRITEPTEGRAEIHGRVGSLLEVGTGFHPELTGRENIQLNGAILGMRRAEIDRRFDEIVAFAEIERFLDTPVKRYSSGMYVRLAFSVAAHLEPEVLLVDEVLAVGDAAFQKKCLGKMGDVAKQDRTVLFVSHNLVAVRSLCQKALWIEGGRLRGLGDSATVASNYLASFQARGVERWWATPAEAPGNDQVRLRMARLAAENGTGGERITTRTGVRIEFEYWNLQPEAHHSVTMNVCDAHGGVVFASDSEVLRCSQGAVRAVCHVPPELLNDEVYRITLVVCQEKSHWIHAFEDVLTLEVWDVERPVGWQGKWPGVVRPRLAWSLEQVRE